MYMEIKTINPIAIVGEFTQVYIDGRTRKSAQVKIVMQEIPEEPDEFDPIKLRIEQARAPEIILYGKRIALSGRDYPFLKCLAEHIGTFATNDEIYQAIYAKDSEVSDYQIYNIKYKLIKELQEILGVKKIPKDWITAEYGRGYRLNMRRCEVEVT